MVSIFEFYLQSSSLKKTSFGDGTCPLKKAQKIKSLPRKLKEQNKKQKSNKGKEKVFLFPVDLINLIFLLLTFHYIDPAVFVIIPTAFNRPSRNTTLSCT